MSVFKGEYMGFSYNGVHSSDLGIVRISNGSRFEENLLPTIQDKTVQVPGNDGTYYFGSYYTQKPINISFAFDELTENQIERMRRLFGDKKIHDLVFDETPYKTYQAKVTGTATMKYVPFDNQANGKIFKGEGSISFVCYQPYAICRRKYLTEYTEEEKIGGWEDASGLLESQGSYDKLVHGAITVYNPGVKATDWMLGLKTSGCYGYKLQLDGARGICFRWNDAVDVPEVLTINSQGNLIESGNEIFNELIVEGDFFKIPINGEEMNKIYIWKLTSPTEDTAVSATESDLDGSIKYNIYYY